MPTTDLRPDRHSPVSDALAIALQAAVPIHIHDTRQWSAQRRQHDAQIHADTVASHGDDLMFGGKGCAATFNALARGIALLAHQPGGVTFAGMHWCTEPHEQCPDPSTARFLAATSREVA